MITEVALVDRPKRLVLSVPEAAGLLGISRRLAYELAARGELPVPRLGGRVLATCFLRDYRQDGWP